MIITINFTKTTFFLCLSKNTANKLLKINEFYLERPDKRTFPFLIVASGTPLSPPPDNSLHFPLKVSFIRNIEPKTRVKCQNLESFKISNHSGKRFVPLKLVYPK